MHFVVRVFVLRLIDRVRKMFIRLQPPFFSEEAAGRRRGGEKKEKKGNEESEWRCCLKKTMGLFLI